MTLRRLLYNNVSHIRESWLQWQPYHPYLRGVGCAMHLLLVPLVVPVAWGYMRLAGRT